MMDSRPQQPSECFRWVIVLCSFISHAASAGLLLSMGVMYVSWLEEFQEPKGVTSWVLSLAYSLHLGFSPVPANLAARYGFRVVAVFGGLLTFVGLVASAFVTSVTQLIITIGLVTGIGSCFSYLPGIAIVPLYFDKWRSLATGIGTTGTGAGAFLLAPFVNYLIETYTWRGAVLVLGAMSLNLCASGLLFRPVDTRSMDVRGGQEEEHVGEETESELKGDQDVIIPQISEQLVETGIPEQHLSANKAFTEVSPPLAQMILLKSRLHVFNNVDNRMHSSLNDLGPTRNPSPHNSFPNLNRPQKRKHSHESLIRSIRNLDTTLLGSLGGFHVLKEDTNNEDMNNIPCHQTNGSEHQVQDMEDPLRNRSWVIQQLAFLGEISHLNILRDSYFFIYCVSNFLACLSFYTAAVFTVDRAVHEGIDVAIGAILISVCGCGNILGRIITGLFSDCCHNRLLSYSVALCIQGIGTAMSALCGDIAMLHIIYAAFLGFHMGIYAVLSPLVTVDLQGTSNIAMAYGVVLMFMGLASVIGAPISGRD